MFLLVFKMGLSKEAIVAAIRGALCDLPSSSRAIRSPHYMSFLVFLNRAVKREPGWGNSGCTLRPAVFVKSDPITAINVVFSF